MRSGYRFVITLAIIMAVIGVGLGNSVTTGRSSVSEGIAAAAPAGGVTTQQTQPRRRRRRAEREPQRGGVE